MVILISTVSFAVVAAIYFGRRAYILAGLLADSESARINDQEYYESIESVNEYMYTQIESAYNKMKEIDRIGAFENDDEAGTTFNLLNEVITNLYTEFNGETNEEIQ